MLLKCGSFGRQTGWDSPIHGLRGGLAIHSDGETDLSTLPFGAFGQAVIDDLGANGTFWISSCFRLNPNFQIFILFSDLFRILSIKLT